MMAHTSTVDKISEDVHSSSDVSQVPVKKQKKLILVAVTFLMVVALAIGATGGILFGGKLSKTAYKEAWATYNNTDNGVVIKQRYIVDENEVLIVKPGCMSLIYDFKRSQNVLLLDGREYTSSDDCVCFLYDFGIYENTSIGEFQSYLDRNNEEINENGSFVLKQYILDVKERVWNQSNMGKRSREICHGCALWKTGVKEMEGSDASMGKRRTRNYDLHCYYWDSLFCFNEPRDGGK